MVTEASLPELVMKHSNLGGGGCSVPPGKVRNRTVKMGAQFSPSLKGGLFCKGKLIK